jgi:hypothetical protein
MWSVIPQSESRFGLPSPPVRLQSRSVLPFLAHFLLFPRFPIFELSYTQRYVAGSDHTVRKPANTPIPNSADRVPSVAAVRFGCDINNPSLGLGQVGAAKRKRGGNIQSRNIYQSSDINGTYSFVSIARPSIFLLIA